MKGMILTFASQQDDDGMAGRATDLPAWSRGPYGETQEVLAGYWIVEGNSFDRVTEIAGRLAACLAPEHVAANAYADVRPDRGIRRRSSVSDESR